VADLRIKRNIAAVSRGTSDGPDEQMPWRGTRSGCAITADWLMGLALEGRCFGLNGAIGATADDLGDTYTNTKPDLYVAVPAGTTIIPVYIEVCMEDTATAAASYVFAAASEVCDTSAGGTAGVIYNMRTDAPIKSMCTGTKTAATSTNHATSGKNFVEFWRGYAGYADDWFNSSAGFTNALVNKTSWCIGDALVPPVIVGAGSLSIFASFTAGTGYITVIWAELPSNTIV